MESTQNPQEKLDDKTEKQSEDLNPPENKTELKEGILENTVSRAAVFNPPLDSNFRDFRNRNMLSISNDLSSQLNNDVKESSTILDQNTVDLIERELQKVFVKEKINKYSDDISKGKNKNLRQFSDELKSELKKDGISELQISNMVPTLISQSYEKSRLGYLRQEQAIEVKLEKFLDKKTLKKGDTKDFYIESFCKEAGIDINQFKNNFGDLENILINRHNRVGKGVEDWQEKTSLLIEEFALSTKKDFKSFKLFKESFSNFSKDQEGRYYEDKITLSQLEDSYKENRKTYLNEINNIGKKAKNFKSKDTFNSYDKYKLNFLKFNPQFKYFFNDEIETSLRENFEAQNQIVEDKKVSNDNDSFSSKNEFSEATKLHGDFLNEFCEFIDGDKFSTSEKKNIFDKIKGKTNIKEIFSCLLSNKVFALELRKTLSKEHTFASNFKEFLFKRLYRGEEGKEFFRSNVVDHESYYKVLGQASAFDQEKLNIRKQIKNTEKTKKKENGAEKGKNSDKQKCTIKGLEAFQEGVLGNYSQEFIEFVQGLSRENQNIIESKTKNLNNVDQKLAEILSINPVFDLIINKLHSSSYFQIRFKGLFNKVLNKKLITSLKNSLPNFQELSNILDLDKDEVLNSSNDVNAKLEDTINNKGEKQTTKSSRRILEKKSIKESYIDQDKGKAEIPDSPKKKINLSDTQSKVNYVLKKDEKKSNGNILNKDDTDIDANNQPRDIIIDPKKLESSLSEFGENQEQKSDSVVLDNSEERSDDETDVHISKQTDKESIPEESKPLNTENDKIDIDDEDNIDDEKDKKQEEAPKDNVLSSQSQTSSKKTLNEKDNQDIQNANQDEQEESEILENSGESEINQDEARENEGESEMVKDIITEASGESDINQDEAMETKGKTKGESEMVKDIVTEASGESDMEQDKMTESNGESVINEDDIANTTGENSNDQITIKNSDSNQDENELRNNDQVENQEETMKKPKESDIPANIDHVSNTDDPMDSFNNDNKRSNEELDPSNNETSGKTIDKKDGKEAEIKAEKDHLTKELDVSNEDSNGPKKMGNHVKKHDVIKEKSINQEEIIGNESEGDEVSDIKAKTLKEENENKGDNIKRTNENPADDFSETTLTNTKIKKSNLKNIYNKQNNINDNVIKVENTTKEKGSNIFSDIDLSKNEIIDEEKDLVQASAIEAEDNKEDPEEEETTEDMTEKKELNQSKSDNLNLNNKEITQTGEKLVSAIKQVINNQATKKQKKVKKRSSKSTGSNKHDKNGEDLEENEEELYESNEGVLKTIGKYGKKMMDKYVSKVFNLKQKLKYRDLEKFKLSNLVSKVKKILDISNIDLEVVIEEPLLDMNVKDFETTYNKIISFVSLNNFSKINLSLTNTSNYLEVITGKLTLKTDKESIDIDIVLLSNEYYKG